MANGQGGVGVTYMPTGLIRISRLTVTAGQAEILGKRLRSQNWWVSVFINGLFYTRPLIFRKGFSRFIGGGELIPKLGHNNKIGIFMKSLLLHVSKM